MGTASGSIARSGTCGGRHAASESGRNAGAGQWRRRHLHSHARHDAFTPDDVGQCDVRVAPDHFGIVGLQGHVARGGPRYLDRYESASP